MPEQIKPHPLHRDGTSQQDRFLPALDPNFVLVDERSVTDLMRFAEKYAEQFIYYNAQNQNSGKDWKAFFDIKKIFGSEDYAKIEADILSRSNHQPYYALFMAFLLLFRHAQQHLNQITKKHLDYYYHTVLGLDFHEGTPDKVHVVFELAKGMSPFKLDEDTILDAGKDATAKKLHYRTTDDIILNDAVIGDFRSIFTNNNQVLFAPIANSSDGTGGKLDTSNPKWKAFGHENLNTVQIGFALASPVLEMLEGERKIVTEIIMINSGFTASSPRTFTNALEIYFSGEKAWLGAFTTNTATLTKVTAARTKLTITQLIPKEEKKITGFSSKLTGGFNTSSPMMQVKIPVSQTALYSLLKNAETDSVKITVTVDGITTLDISNDDGNLNAKKPFFPFGTQPVIGSALSINYSELNNKSIDDFKFSVEWLDPPSNFKEYYKNYEDYEHTSEVNLVRYNTSFKAAMYLKGDNQGNVSLFDEDDATNGVSWPKDETISLRYTRELSIRSESAFFAHPNYMAAKPSYYYRPVNLYNVQLRADNMATTDLFRFELRQTFMHKEFPGVLAVAMIKQPSDSSALPKQPYTPKIKSISLEYTASTGTISFANATFSSFNAKQVQLFHLGVFGHSEEHRYLKSKLGFEFDNKVFVLPQYNNEGEFYFSISKIAPLESVKVLFQLAEGSENPEREKSNIEWSILSSNVWQKLNDSYILSDTTNHLLSSGIIQFLIPSSATADNVLFEPGKYWIKAAIEKDTDAVCQFIDVVAQAEVAEFYDQDNDALHLATALPANTISKLVQKKTEIKKVSQPYASFGGVMKEDAGQFYVRVSERLRHKQRAATIWDYEHLILQEFPSLYMVKCISHALRSKENSCCENTIPGEVTLVLVPSLQNQNAINPLEPRVSLDMLTKVEDYVNRINSFFITARAQNPVYETVLLDFCVRFTNNDSFQYYSNQLNEDIKQFLSPWAYGSNEIHFGGKIHKSVLINFIEELEYVDFITEVFLYHITSPFAPKKDSPSAQASDERAILVSSTQHTIRPIDQTKTCA